MSEDDARTISLEIKRYIISEFLPGSSEDEVTESTPLITGGVLDSISTIKLVSFLENRFGVRFDAHELDDDHLDTLDRIAATVMAKQQK
jgi:acyl carrier protein